MTPRLAQLERLVEGRDREAVGAGGLERERDRDRAVPVGVGLDDGLHPRARARRSRGAPRGCRAGRRGRSRARPSARAAAARHGRAAPRSAPGPARARAVGRSRRAQPGLRRDRRQLRASRGAVARRLLVPRGSSSRAPNPSRRPARCRSAIAASRLRTIGTASGRSLARRPGVADPLADELAGLAVEVDAQPRRVVRGETLGEQRPDRPGQHVARAAGGHRRVLERRDHRPSRRGRR